MKLNGWQRLWVVMTLSWIIFVAVLAYRASEGVSLFHVFKESLILPIALYLLGLLVAWVIRSFKREKKPNLDATGIILKDYNDDWGQYKKQKSAEDDHKYQARNEAYETRREMNKKKKHFNPSPNEK